MCSKMSVYLFGTSGILSLLNTFNLYTSPTVVYVPKDVVTVIMHNWWYTSLYTDIMGPYCRNKPPSTKPLQHCSGHQASPTQPSHPFSSLVPRQSFWNCVNTSAVPYNKRGANTRHLGPQSNVTWEANNSTPINLNFTNMWVKRVYMLDDSDVLKNMVQYMQHMRWKYMNIRYDTPLRGQYGLSEHGVRPHGFFSAPKLQWNMSFLSNKLMANTTGNHMFTLQYQGFARSILDIVECPVIKFINWKGHHLSPMRHGFHSISWCLGTGHGEDQEPRPGRLGITKAASKTHSPIRWFECRIFLECLVHHADHHFFWIPFRTWSALIKLGGLSIPILVCCRLFECSKSLSHSIESWLVDRDSPFLDSYNPPYNIYIYVYIYIYIYMYIYIYINILGSIIPQLIINQHGLSSHCSFEFQPSFLRTNTCRKRPQDQPLSSIVGLRIDGGSKRVLMYIYIYNIIYRIYIYIYIYTYTQYHISYITYITYITYIIYQYIYIY